LVAGDNTVTVWATDANASTSSVTFVVTYSGTSANQAPVVTAYHPFDESNNVPTDAYPPYQTINWPVGGTSVSASLAGLVSDDGLPNGSSVTSTWSQVSGPNASFSSTTSLTPTVTMYQAGTYVFRLTASDTALTSTSDVVVTVMPSGTVQAAVDCGSTSTKTGADGTNYAADNSPSPGTNTTTSLPVWVGSATIPDTTIYQSLRAASAADLTYNFTVPNGTYDVDLKFIEPGPLMIPGARVFNILAQGSVVASNVDIYNRVGQVMTLWDEYPPYDHVLSGIPVVNGTMTVTLHGTVGYPVISGIVVRQPAQPPAGPVILNGPPPASATVSTTVYSFTYTASGTPSPAFSISSGQLPPGLSLSSTGVIAGTPTAAGTFNATASAVNGIGSPATQNFTITVAPAVPAQPSLINGPLPVTATVGVAYNFTYQFNGYPAPTFTVSVGSLPTGLTLSAAGKISGTPSASGVYTGTISATNGIGSPATQNFSIIAQVAPTLVKFNLCSTPGGNWNSINPAGNGGWVNGSVSNAKDYNTGNATSIKMAVTTAFTWGQNYGTPSTALYPSPIQTYGYATTGTAAVTVSGLDTSSHYNFTVFGSGAGISGTGTFSIGTTTLGLAIGNNTSNTVTFNNVAPDGTGKVVLTVAKGGTNNYNELCVVEVALAGNAPVLTSGAPPANATVGTAYSFTYTATGTPTPFYALIAGSLPPGLSLSAGTGALTGTPTTPGHYTGTVSASNGFGSAATSNFAITVTGTYDQWASVYFPGQPGSSGASATPMNDGITNLMKYLCNINPSIPMTATARASLPAVGTANNGTVLTLTYHQNPAATGVVASLETSPDLVTWNQVLSPDYTQTSVDPNTGDTIVTVGVNTNNASKEFIRLNVSQ